MIDPAYCQNCGTHLDSIPSNTSVLDPKFKGWDYWNHKCKDVLAKFKPPLDEGLGQESINYFLSESKQFIK